MKKVIILGAGISGLSCSYHLNKSKVENKIYEKRDRWGGLCDNFTIDGFRFDRFVHFSHTKSDYVRDLFAQSSPSIIHKPDSNNYYNGTWLDHPAQNNLKPLPLVSKLKSIQSFINRPHVEIKDIKDYDQWLEVQYGSYFSEEFPKRYTKKYWCVEANELETSWVGQRMYSPSLREVIQGAFFETKENKYYAKEMRYPEKGGYKSYLKKFAKDATIQTNKEVTAIDPNLKTVTFSDNTTESYDILVTSLPLKTFPLLVNESVDEVINAANSLDCTSAVLVSIGLNIDKLPSKLWFYVYDEDIVFARVYSPSMKSPDNVPEGCSSLQAEIYFKNAQTLSQEDLDSLKKKTIKSLVKMEVIKEENIVVQDVRYEPYANVIFTKDIAKKREIIRNHYQDKDIYFIGRFGEWEYLWSDQSFLSGQKVANQIIQNFSKN